MYDDSELQKGDLLQSIFSYDERIYYNHILSNLLFVQLMHN